jgi:hypothetical protein
MGKEWKGEMFLFMLTNFESNQVMGCNTDATFFYVNKVYNNDTNDSHRNSFIIDNGTFKNYAFEISNVRLYASEMLKVFPE